MSGGAGHTALEVYNAEIRLEWESSFPNGNLVGRPRHQLDPFLLETNMYFRCACCREVIEPMFYQHPNHEGVQPVWSMPLMDRCEVFFHGNCWYSQRAEDLRKRWDQQYHDEWMAKHKPNHKQQRRRK